MLHEAEVSYAKPQDAERDEADIVDMTVAKVICFEVACRVKLAVGLLSQE